MVAARAKDIAALQVQFATWQPLVDADIVKQEARDAFAGLDAMAKSAAYWMATGGTVSDEVVRAIHHEAANLMVPISYQAQLCAVGGKHDHIGRDGITGPCLAREVQS